MLKCLEWHPIAGIHWHGRTTMRASIALLACTMLVTPALANFTRTPPPLPFTDGYFECAIVGHTSERDSDPVYKINVNVNSDSAGKFNSMGIVHTVRSGRTYDRSEQYRQDDIWQTQGRMEWYWKGHRGNVTMVGELYRNERDGWMYSERLFQNGHHTACSPTVTRCKETSTKDGNKRAKRRSAPKAAGAAASINWRPFTTFWQRLTRNSFKLKLSAVGPPEHSL
jgi:hypothetical protein